MRSKTTKTKELPLPSTLIIDKIRAERIKKSYTQAYMAHKLGISEKAYQNIETNNNRSITIDRIHEVANILDIDWANLLILENGHANQANNFYSMDKDLAHRLEKSEQENIFLREKNTFLESKIRDLEEILVLLREKTN